MKLLGKYKKSGFTLIELILVISVGMVISMLSFTSMVKNQEDLQSKALGQQIKQIADASNLYITNHYDLISALQNSTGSATDPGPRTCVAATFTCNITVQTLINEGFLPNSYSQKNFFGSGYNITLKRSGTAPYYNISGVAITNSSLITGTGNNIRYDMLGKAMQEAGIDSGMTRTSPTVLEGFKGGWNNTSAEYSIINKQGLLGYQLGYGSNSYSVFLRRDGTLPMTGNLNMNSNDINSAKNITASATIQGATLKSTGDTNVGGDLTTAGTSTLTGAVTASNTITAAGRIRSNSYFEGQNGGGDGFRIGGNDANDYEFALYTAKPLTVWRSGGASNETRFQVYGKQINTGDLFVNASGDGLSGGNITAGNWVWAKNGNGDVIGFGGDNVGGANADYEIRLNSDKTLTIYSPNKAANSIVFNVNGNQTVYGNLTASGNIETSQFVNIKTAVSAGSACTSVGLLSRDGAGQVLSCRNGIWEPEQPVGIPQPWPSATPPTGWLICNGQTFNTSQYPLLAKAYPSGKLPDLRGSFIRGLDQGRGIDGGRGILTEQRSSVVGGTDDNWSDNDFGVLHGPSSAYSRDTINVYDYTTGSNGQDPKYWVHMSGGSGPSTGTSQSIGNGISLSNNGSNGFYGGARPFNTAFVYIVRAL